MKGKASSQLGHVLMLLLLSTLLYHTESVLPSQQLSITERRRNMRRVRSSRSPPSPHYDKYLPPPPPQMPHTPPPSPRMSHVAPPPPPLPPQPPVLLSPSSP